MSEAEVVAEFWSFSCKNLKIKGEFKKSLNFYEFYGSTKKLLLIWNFYTILHITEKPSQIDECFSIYLYWKMSI